LVKDEEIEGFQVVSKKDPLQRWLGVTGGNLRGTTTSITDQINLLAPI